MEILSWSSDFGLPSWHQKCLAMQTYSKMSGAPVNIRATDNPFWTPEGDLPVFRHASRITTSSYDQFVRYLEEVGYSTDSRLSAKEKSESVAFREMVKNSLTPALALGFWVNAKNHIELTRPWYGRRLMFPLGLIYPKRYWNGSLRLVCSATSLNIAAQDTDEPAQAHDMEYAIMEKTILKRADECLSHLAVRLGKDPFMFGPTPSSLDAIVFSFIAPMFKTPLPSPIFNGLTQKHSNLNSYVSRIIVTYFPDVVTKTKPEETDQKDKSKEEEKSKGFLSGWKNTLLSVLVAAIAMGGYAYIYNMSIQIEWES